MIRPPTSMMIRSESTAMHREMCGCEVCNAGTTSVIDADQAMVAYVK